jgi:site-specific DNA-methyltransferase (adenine-specific)
MKSSFFTKNLFQLRRKGRLTMTVIDKTSLCKQPYVTIHEGDCIDIMRTLQAASVDMVLADLPYGTTYAPWDCTISLDALWTEWLRVTKPNAAIVLTASQPFTSALVMSRPKLFRCEWIWDKVNGANFANANKQPMKTHESVLVFATGQPTYNPQKIEGAKNHTQGNSLKANVSETRLISKRISDDLSGMKFPKSIQIFPKHSSQSRLHSTQKPVDLFAYFIRSYSNEGDLILDCTAGSGTTGEAALREGRSAVLIDNKPEYVITMRNRLPLAVVVKE